jgi:hypothetical protein
MIVRWTQARYRDQSDRRISEAPRLLRNVFGCLTLISRPRAPARAHLPPHVSLLARFGGTSQGVQQKLMRTRSDRNHHERLRRLHDGIEARSHGWAMRKRDRVYCATSPRSPFADYFRISNKRLGTARSLTSQKPVSGQLRDRRQFGS